MSFGLPQSGGGGGYPINSYGGNPLTNPYPGYGSGTQGINLGLVSVNPLVSVQVTKDDYGEKVVKPFVNLHVTPNHGLVNKFTNFLSQKKHLLHGGNYAPNYNHHGPSQGYGPWEQYNRPSHYERPQENYHNHHHFYHPQRPQGNYGNYGNSGNYGNYGHSGYFRGDDYDEGNKFGDYGDYDGYYRNARTNDSIESSRDFDEYDSNNYSRENRNNQGGKVAFPSRRRRDVEEVRENSGQIAGQTKTKFISIFQRRSTLSFFYHEKT